MGDQLKKKAAVGVVGLAAVGAAYFLGGELDWASAIQVLISGDISELCQNLEDIGA